MSKNNPDEGLYHPQHGDCKLPQLINITYPQTKGVRFSVDIEYVKLQLLLSAISRSNKNAIL